MEGGGMDHKEVIVMCELPGCMGLIPGAGGASKAVVPEREGAPQPEPEQEADEKGDWHRGGGLPLRASPP